MRSATENRLELCRVARNTRVLAPQSGEQASEASTVIGCTLVLATIVLVVLFVVVFLLHWFGIDP